MFGIQLDALDPTLVALGVLIGSLATYFIMRRAEKHQDA